MSPINPSVAHFLDVLTRELGELLSQNQAGTTTASWNPEPQEWADSEMVWWSCGLSVDPACRVHCGAPRETWEQVTTANEASGIVENDSQGDCFKALALSIQKAAETRIGSQILCTNAGLSEKPPEDWTAVTVEIVRGEHCCPSMLLALSRDLQAALDRSEESSEPIPTEEQTGRQIVTDPGDVLMQVEMPVSVSFGSTRMRMKDLLGLTNGSIVGLDRELGDEVEVRVNNCVIARGEVVAVDGNYGVRILAVASGRNGQGVRGALSGEPKRLTRPNGKGKS